MIKNLLNKYSDKLGHLGLSFMLVVILHSILQLFITFVISITTSVLLILVVGIYKEMYMDKKLDGFDLLANGIGILLATLTLIILL